MPANDCRYIEARHYNKSKIRDIMALATKQINILMGNALVIVKDESKTSTAHEMCAQWASSI